MALFLIEGDMERLSWKWEWAALEGSSLRDCEVVKGRLSEIRKNFLNTGYGQVWLPRKVTGKYWDVGLCMYYFLVQEGVMLLLQV